MALHEYFACTSRHKSYAFWCHGVKSVKLDFFFSFKLSVGILVKVRNALHWLVSYFASFEIFFLRLV